MSAHRPRAPRALVLAALGALLALACAPAAALAGPTVTVRIEGESSTLLPATTVTLGAPEPVSGCAADSVAAAINLAVAGNWDHGEANHGGGDFTQTILGETHAFTRESDTWAEWVNYKWGGGICSDLLGEGAEVVIVADHEPEPFYAPTVLPLVVAGVPSVVQAGTPFSVTVSAVHTPAGAFAEAGEGTPEPASGVTVSAGGASAVTNSNGVATLAVAQTGPVSLRASKLGDASSRTFFLCSHNGNDGNCGTSAPGTPAPLPGSEATAAAPYTGPFAIVAHLTGLHDGASYARRHAPRVLAGSVASQTALASVSLELRRVFEGRCFAYNGARERFVRARCGHGSFFAVSSGETFSYLLPSALPPGRYVLDVRARDAAGHTTVPVRGSTRVVFRVR